MPDLLATPDRAIHPAMKRLAPLVALAACTQQPATSERANATDPAVADAVAGPIMSDMQMGGTAAPDALRPGEQPATLPVPVDARIDTEGAPTLGAVAGAAMRDAAFGGCTAEIGYSALWSVKLPPAFALPKEARLAEAAGSDRPGCALRIVRFAIPGAPAGAVASFSALARREGFAVSEERNAMRAVRVRDGAAVRMGATLSRDGSRVDLVIRSR